MKKLKSIENALRKQQNFVITKIIYDLIKWMDIIEKKDESLIFKMLYIEKISPTEVSKLNSISSRSLLNLRYKFGSYFLNFINYNPVV